MKKPSVYWLALSLVKIAMLTGIISIVSQSNLAKAQTAVIEGPKEAAVGKLIMLSLEQSDCTHWLWFLPPDAQFLEADRQIALTFSSGGTKEIKLAVSNSKGIAGASWKIEVDGPPPGPGPGPGPNPNPNPNPNPQPEPPKPEPPKPDPVVNVEGAWLLFLEETEDRTPEIAALRADLAFWDQFTARGVRFRAYDISSDDAKRNNYPQQIADIGAPALLIIAPDPANPGKTKVLGKSKLPMPKDDISAFVKKVTGK